MDTQNELLNRKVKLLGDTLALLFAFYAILCLSPYFLWSTFQEGFFERVLGTMQTVNCIALIITIIGAINIFLNPLVPMKNLVLIGIVFISAIIIIYISGRENVISKRWIVYLPLFVFLLTSNEIKEKTFAFFSTAFAVILIPAIIWHLMVNFLNIDVPYNIIESINKTKVAEGYSYHHYWGGVQLWGKWNPIVRYRFCGIYDEPGVVGTVAGLLLPINLMKNNGKRITNILLLLEGVLSTSLAFIVLMLLFYVMNNLFNGKLKGIAVIMLIIVSYLVFIKINFSNEMISTIQTRLQITSSGLEGDNRTSDFFDKLFFDFQHSGNMMILLFGNGPNAMSTIEGHSYSYKNIIYDYGYVVFALFIGFIFTFIAVNIKRSFMKELVILVILILANIYQRAGLFYFPYMLILIGGTAYLMSEQKVEIVE